MTATCILQVDQYRKKLTRKTQDNSSNYLESDRTPCVVVIIHRLEVMTAIRNQAQNQIKERKVDGGVRRVHDPGPDQDHENVQAEKIATDDILVRVLMKDPRQGDQAKNQAEGHDRGLQVQEGRRNDVIKLLTKRLCNYNFLYFTAWCKNLQPPVKRH